MSIGSGRKRYHGTGIGKGIKAGILMNVLKRKGKLQTEKRIAAKKRAAGLFLGLVLLIGAGMQVLADFDPAKPLPSLTGRYVYDLLNIAESQKDYHESADTGETVYSDWAGQSGNAWCSEFVSWCARQAQIPEDIIPTKRSAAAFRTAFYGKGSYYLLEGGIGEAGCGCGSRAAGTLALSDLRPGDILLVETNTPDNFTTLDHTALCRGVKNGKILTVEGNVNKTYTINGAKVKLGTVVVRTREVSEIHGVCRPVYSDYCGAYGEHSWDSGVIVQNATCTEEELVKYTCRICDEEKTVANGKLPHTEVIDAAIQATCESAGMTEGKHCADCGVVITAQQETEPLGHIWNAGEVQVEAKPLTAGWKRFTCTVCGEIKTESIPALGAPAVGTLLTDVKTEGRYIVTKAGVKNGTVAYAGPTDKRLPSVTIRSKVTIDGITYRVTAVADRAFRNNKYLKEVTIPSTVKQIGKQAFYNCKKLKTITVKTKSLTKKRIGSKAFTGISSRAVFRVPKSKMNTYKKLFRAKGAGKNTVFRTY